MPNNLLIEGPEQGVQVFILNRPQALHALNTELLTTLSTALAGTADRQEGLGAFLEKRKPRFTGR